MLAKFRRSANGGVWIMHPKVIEKLVVLADGSGCQQPDLDEQRVQGAPPMS